MRGFQGNPHHSVEVIGCQLQHAVDAPLAAAVAGIVGDIQHRLAGQGVGLGAARSVLGVDGVAVYEAYRDAAGNGGGVRTEPSAETAGDAVDNL